MYFVGCGEVGKEWGMRLSRVRRVAAEERKLKSNGNVMRMDGS